MVSRLISELEKQLKLQLPGIEVQNKMAPLKIKEREAFRKNYPQKGGVLVLLYPAGNSIKIALMLRPENMGVHSDQVSFPGGKFEQGDETMENTALREAKEELGIEPSKIKLIGALTELYIPASNFVVYPFLAVSEVRPDFVPHSVEVKKIIEMDIVQLLDESIVKSKPVFMSVLGKELVVPYFDFEGHTIWGATAMILGELKELLKRTGLIFS